MKCPRCGTQSGPSDAFCANCGAPLGKSDTARSTPQTPHYISASELESVHRGAPKLFLALALVAGLLVGGFFIWVRRSRLDSPAEPTSIGETRQAPEPKPPPALDNARPTQTSVPFRNESKKEGGSLPTNLHPVKRQGHKKVKSDEEKTTRSEIAPVALNADAPSQTPAILPNLTATAAANKPSHPAVQETESETAPLPSLPESAAQRDNRPAPVPTPSVPAPTTSVTSTRPAYRGPRAGIATWSGKLDKGQALTIRDGTPSTGILSGAGLPGVPVRITIDQANLGFGEMPSAANGFRTLVLRSHNKHDKITIRWEVIE